MRRALPALAALLFAFGLWPDSAAAQAPVYRGEFTLSFLGFTVARINFDTRIDQDRYSIKGDVSSAGLGAFFYDTRGTLVASGRFKDGVQAERFRADYRYNDKPTLVDIQFEDGNVSKVVNEPPLKKRGKDWVPIGPEDLKSVVDPIAATLVKAKDLGEVCNSRARMFDGELRADLSLTYVKSGEMSVKGFDGPTVTCRMRFTPAAGYRKGRRALEYISTKSRIMVTFAEIGQTGVYVPIHATIGTQIGTITVKARRFEALQ